MGMCPTADSWSPSLSISLYEQLERIEEGTYGVVYKAREKQSGELVAIKRLKLDNEREGFPITSIREISALFALKHPNIINLRQVVVGDSLSSVYLVMDYVENDLRALMDEHASLFHLSEVKTVVHQLLSAVAFMHEHWVVHRDLKTSNLLMGNDGQIRVADFGLARRIGEPGPGNLTEVVVTLWYRAPEVLLGSREYGPPVDLWSVGCIMAELILGKALFPGKGEIDQMDRLISVLGLPSARIWPDFVKLPHAGKLPTSGNEYNLLDKIFTNLPPTGIDLLDRLLTFDPKRRISAAEALKHPFFADAPLPKDPSQFPSWPPVKH